MRGGAILLSLSAAAMLAGCEERKAEGAATAASAQSAGDEDAALAQADDGTLLTLAGSVVATGTNWFTLAVGGDEVTVEMDDWDWFKEGAALKAGDQVSVTGRVDHDLWEQKKLEASSVYVRNLGITFFANGADEEDLAVGLVAANSMSSAEGFVTAVEGEEFTVGGLTGPVRIDSSQLRSKPAIKVGDRVYSWGEIDLDPRERAEIMAEGIILLSPDKTKKITPNEQDNGNQPQPA